MGIVGVPDLGIGEGVDGRWPRALSLASALLATAKVEDSRVVGQVMHDLKLRLERMDATSSDAVGHVSSGAEWQAIVASVSAAVALDPRRVCILRPEPGGTAGLMHPGGLPLLAEGVADDAVVVVDWHDGFQALRNATHGCGHETWSSLLSELGVAPEIARDVADAVLIAACKAKSVAGADLTRIRERVQVRFGQYLRDHEHPPMKVFVRRLMVSGITPRYYPEVVGFKATLDESDLRSCYGSSLKAMADNGMTPTRSVSKYVENCLVKYSASVSALQRLLPVLERFAV